MIAEKASKPSRIGIVEALSFLSGTFTLPEIIRAAKTNKQQVF